MLFYVMCLPAVFSPPRQFTLLCSSLLPFSLCFYSCYLYCPVLASFISSFLLSYPISSFFSPSFFSFSCPPLTPSLSFLSSSLLFSSRHSLPFVFLILSRLLEGFQESLLSLKNTHATSSPLCQPLYSEMSPWIR
jgi:hypothetical protein